MIHPTAIVSPKAELGANVRVGPYAVIDGEVIIGDNCDIGPYVYITGRTKIGKNNRFHAGAVIGDLPQDLRFSGEATGMLLGDNNVIREHVTIHRSSKPSEPTTIGSNNFLMANCHVGHNSVVKNGAIIANGALLGGHVLIEDQARISGNCLVHQFVRVGTLAMMQGGSAISKDLPPYAIARGDNGICGINVIGMRRAGFTSDERMEIKRVYRALFRQKLKLREAVEAARALAASERARVLVEFAATATERGMCSDVGGRTEGDEE